MPDRCRGGVGPTPTRSCPESATGLSLAIMSTSTPPIDTMTERLVALCEAILSDEQVVAAQQGFDSFLANDDARKLWQDFEHLASSLHQKQHRGEALPVADTERYEELREKIDTNGTVVGFLKARQVLGGIQQKVSQYVGLSLELGRVPDADDLAAQGGGGCCGGGDGGGCGCH